MLSKARYRTVAAVAFLAVAVAACGGSGSPEEDGAEEQISVAFFGFAAANSFAQATWAGVQQAAEEANGTAEFFDGEFQGSTQVSQMKDALVSDEYNVWVVQANDGAAVMPQVERAIDDGISVVAEFTPVGPRYDTAEPQVDGLISFVDVPTHNGKILGELGIEACGDTDPCQVAYLQGDPSLPLDNARTEAVVAELSSDSAVEVVARPVGGYTKQDGRRAGQDLMVAHPDVDVIIGSSQAIQGVQLILEQQGRLDDVQLVGNGGSVQAVDAVKTGAWYATYHIPEQTEGYEATKLAIQHARGETVEMATDAAQRFTVRGTKESLEGIEGQYRD